MTLKDSQPGVVASPAISHEPGQGAVVLVMGKRPLLWREGAGRGWHRVAVQPDPTTIPAATGEMNEWLRNSSRACTLEMWHSISRSFAPLMASCSASEVWVYAPGLKTAPIRSPAAYRLPASWIQSISAPSWFDCRQSASSSYFAASSRQSPSTSASVLTP